MCIHHRASDKIIDLTLNFPIKGVVGKVMRKVGTGVSFFIYSINKILTSNACLIYHQGHSYRHSQGLARNRQSIGHNKRSPIVLDRQFFVMQGKTHASYCEYRWNKVVPQELVFYLNYLSQHIPTVKVVII